MNLRRIKRIIEMLTNNEDYLDYTVKIEEEDNNYNIKLEINEDDEEIIITF